MSAAVGRSGRVGVRQGEAPWVRRLLIGLALGFMFLFLVLPLLAVFTEALRLGWGAYFEALRAAVSYTHLTLPTKRIV